MAGSKKPKSASRHYVPRPGTRRKATDFLKAWEQYGAAFPSYQAFCGSHGYSYSWVRRLRQRWPEFEKKMDSIRDRHRIAVPETTETSPELAMDRYAHLAPAWKGLFLEHWRTKLDRGAAWDLVGKTLDDVEEARESDPAFAEAYDRVQREIAARMDDALVRGGLGGRVQAQTAYLNARMPGVYGKGKGRDGAAGPSPAPSQDARGRARATWGEIYGRHYPPGGDGAAAEAPQ